MLQELKTDRLILRPFRDGDAHNIAMLMNNWNVAKWLAVVPWPYTLEDADEFLERRETKTGPGFSLAIDNGDGLVGVMAVHTPNPDWGIEDVNTLEIGYWLGEPHWGQGYVTEAGRAALTHAFEALGVKRLVAGAITENAGSCNVLTKLGFEQTGTGDFYCRPQDKRVPSTQFDLTRARWRTLQAIG
ncbi:MAG: GNAT family N-acetyltransferase [Alphaproteobacteria bacterium]